MNKLSPEASYKAWTMRIVWTIVILATLLLATYIVYDLNGHSLDLTNREVLLVITDSMDGDETEYEIASFPKDTVIVIKHLSYEELYGIEVGDVISFKILDGRLNHHRVVALHLDDPEGPWIECCGDNPTYHSTDQVPLKDINGKVVGTSVPIGHLVTFLKGNFLLVIALLAAFAVAGEVVRYARGSKGAEA